MPSPDEKPSRKQRLLRISVVAAAALLILYAVTGFWILPGILKTRLPGLIAEQLPVKAAVGEIDLNPFLLTASLRDVTVKANDGQHMFGLETLYADLRFTSLFRGAIGLKELRITGPDALVQILPDGRINLSAVLPPKADASEADGDQPARLPLLIVDRFVLEGGKLVFRDRSSTTPFEATVSSIQVNVQDFSTRSDAESRFSFQATSDLAAQIDGKGHFAVQPVAARGAVNVTGIQMVRLWRAIQDAVRFEISDGRLDLAGRFEVGDGADAVKIKLTDGRAQLQRFRLAAKGQTVPLIDLPSFSVSGVGFDLNDRQIRIETVQTGDARIRSDIFPDGSVQLLDVLLPEATPSPPAASAPAPQTQPAFKVDDWNMRIGKLAVKNAGIKLLDRGLTPPVPLIFEPIHLSVENLSNQPNVMAAIALEVRDNFDGRLMIDGQAGIRPATADLQVRVLKAAAKKMEPYVRAAANMDILSGTTDVDGRIQYATAGEAPKLTFRGGMRVDNLRIFTPAEQRDLVKFASLAVNGVQVDLEPNRMKIDEIVLSGLDGKLVIEPDGRPSLDRVMETVEKESAEIAGSLPARILKAIRESIQGSVPLRIDKFQVKKASARFEDRSLKPEFAMEAEKLEAEMTDISTEKSARVKVKITGVIDTTAPLDVSGSLAPFGEKADMVMRVSLKDFDLHRISPYSDKHVGYTVRKGKLSLALEYTLSGNFIDGKNEVFMQQLTLGERTDSPNAVLLPLSLAIALLKDFNGNIRFNLPVSGDINDPQFRSGNVFADALIKFVTGVVSSPFKVLGGLGDGIAAEELDRIFFAPGTAALDAEQTEKLAAISDALRERPSLEIEIRGRAYKMLDDQAMAPVPSEDASDEPPAVEEQQLRELAQRRAETIRAALLMGGSIKPKRVKVLLATVQERSTDGRAAATLYLVAN